MATKSSNKKTAGKKPATRPKVAAKKSLGSKTKASTSVKAKPTAKAVSGKKKAINKTAAKPVKNKATEGAKNSTKKIVKVVNKKVLKHTEPAKKISSTKKQAPKAVVKTSVAKKTEVKKKAATVSKVPKKLVKKVAGNVKKEAEVKNTANKSVKPTVKQIKKASKDDVFNDIPLKPVTKPILKKSTGDAAAAQRNLAIRAKYKRVEIEYSVHSAKHILFSYLSTTSGLSEWFADKVNEKGDIMIFDWDGTQQAAKVLSIREDHHIRFRWLDMPEAIFFEFRVETDEITGDLALIITDFCEDESSIESTKNLWNSQIDKLFLVLGIH
jgi:hypothetical protein